MSWTSSGLSTLVEPFGPAGRAAAATLIERQFQLAQQAGDLLARLLNAPNFEIGPRRTQDQFARNLAIKAKRT